MKCIPVEYEPGRVVDGPYWSVYGEICGAFMVVGPCGMPLKILASHGDKDFPWEHVSVSLRNRCPNWEEMCFVKGLFWDDEDTVMQLHPPKSTWVNNHNFCLHLWRPLEAAIPLPPIECV